MGKPEMAVETLKKIQKKHYDNPGLQKILGLAEYQTGDTVAAQRDLNRYTQNGAPDHDVFFTLGEIYDNAGEYAEALDSYERAAALDQADQVSPQRIAAVKQKMTGNEYADKVKKKKEKRETAERGKHISPRITLSVLSGIVGIGAFGGGYIMDMLMKKDYTVYKDYNNKTALDARTTKRVAELRKSIDQKMLYRNVLYSVTGLCVAGVTLTIVIP
jgi:tetratricopeptide (TPR) repeat protein